MKVIFICTGNTCRSPMAEGIFKEFSRTLPNIEVSSAGLMANNGDTVSENSVTACKELGIDISSHKAKQITKEDLLSNDLFVCMTENHTNILISAGISKNMIYTLNVSDPYGGNIELYRECCKEIYDKLLELKEQLLESEK